MALQWRPSCFPLPGGDPLIVGWVLVLCTGAMADGGLSEVDALRERTDALEAHVLDLETRLRETEGIASGAKERLELNERVKVDIGGYVDFGFFAVQGNGSGVRRDLGRTAPPEYGFGDILSSWVLIGDPFSTTINSRGDVADLGDSRAVHTDVLRTGGRPTFLINALNLRIGAKLDNTWFFVGLIDFLPRERAFAGGAFGDLLDVKLVSLRWRHDFAWGTLNVLAGKFDSLLGIEYRQQEAPERLTVTPSLICRYTCGRPVGLKARAEFFDKRFEVSLAVTNGSSSIEQFPFSNEVDFNILKTVSARVGVWLPVGQGLELSVSGALGAQDRQTDNSVPQWHFGAAARFEADAFQAQAEYVMGRAVGKDAPGIRCGLAACLQYKGAYGLVGYRLWTFFVPYLRVDWREADMRSALDYAYVSNVVRATVGLRFEPRSKILLKAEYTFNRELTAFEFPNDVFTTSFVVSY